MKHIRKAALDDLSRIAEILVFTKRMNYRKIFQNDLYSFGEMTVLSVAQELGNEGELLNQFWVYDDGFVKGVLQCKDREVKTLYVDHFFQHEGIGGKLLTFAALQLQADHLWVLQKNEKAIRFYERNGFFHGGEQKLEEGTTEYLLKFTRK